MRPKETSSPKSKQPERFQPYHSYVDRGHPNDYRQEEIGALKRAIRAKENRLVLGLPDVGISNLLRFLVTRVNWGDRHVTFAYLNCDALADCLDTDMFFAEITRQFCHQGLGDNPEVNMPGYEWLKSILLRAGGDPLDRLVVVGDKTDQMLAVAEPAFYRRLKALTDLNKRVCYIFAISPHLAEGVDPDRLLFAGRRLIVGRFNERDLAGAMMEEGQRLEIEFSPAEQKKLAHLTGGHPGLLRAVSSAVVEEGLNLSDPEVRLVERLLSRVDVNSRCQRIWQALDSTQQVALCMIASKQSDRVAPDAIVWLRSFDLIDENNGEYRLFSPIFAGFVTSQLVEPLPQRVTIVAGKAFRGDKEITLRPLEQKLLAVLMVEPGRVYTHDEIAWGVWDSDEVTPDMITGLICQLRSRLGKRYIKTHHRRGYEFIEK
jgi:hypothetical protein